MKLVWVLNGCIGYAWDNWNGAGDCWYIWFCKVLLMINVSFWTEIQQNFKYTFLDVFFSKESENDDKSWKKRSFKAKN